MDDPDDFARWHWRNTPDDACGVFSFGARQWCLALRAAFRAAATSRAPAEDSAAPVATPHITCQHFGEDAKP